MKEKSEHPAPWTWRRNKHDGDQLVAANDLVVLECDDPWITVDAGPYARALIAAAPEMESLLRELFPYFDPLPEDIDPGLGLLLTKMLMLIKRIDAAKAGA